MLYNKIMTIHHDKFAYGKLAPNNEEMDEESILEMLKQLNESETADNLLRGKNENDKKIIKNTFENT